MTKHTNNSFEHFSDSDELINYEIDESNNKSL